MIRAVDIDAQVKQFDLAHLPDAFLDDPYPYYQALRERDPVHRCPDGSWLLTRHADCLAAYKSDAMSSAKTRLFTPKFGATPLLEHHTTSLVFSDPPYHTRVRSTLVDALKPRAIQATITVLETIVEQLLDGLAQRDHFDVIEDYASRIPVQVIASLLTVPVDQRTELRRWSLAILGALEPAVSSHELDTGNRAVTEFIVHLRALVAMRRREPAGTSSDVLSSLVACHDAGDLTELELLHNCIFLLNAGHETTTNLIGNGVYCLLASPNEVKSLAARPNAIKGAIEEILRFASPNQIGNREVGRPTTIGGVAMRAGDQITLCIGAANRDPAVFPDPDRFDIARTPNPHLAFGGGIHACVGMALARIEGKVALEALLRKFPALAVDGAPTLRRRVRFRGFAHLPVTTMGDSEPISGTETRRPKDVGSK